MIQSTELRVGNIVLKHFEGGQGEQEVVTSRTIFDCQVNPTGKFTYTGIPLSKEVLLACGFKFSGSLWDIETEENGLFFIEFAGNCVTITAKGKNWGHCTSLHQLQNLFYWLTKTELNYTP